MVTQTPVGGKPKGITVSAAVVSKSRRRKKKNERILVKKSFQAVFGGRTEVYLYKTSPRADRSQAMES